ncbi:MAG: signal peptidase II [Chloroflexota bacterium]
MNLSSKLTTTLIPATLIVLLDQWTKRLAVTHLIGRQPINYFGDIFRLTYAENPGAFMSLGANLAPALRTGIFTVFVSAFLIYFFFYLIGNDMRPIAYFFGGLVLAGGLGNLIDRLVNDGAVIDFMRIRVGPLQTGIFNIADMAIMVGVFGLLIFGERRMEDTEEPVAIKNGQDLPD